MAKNRKTVRLETRDYSWPGHYFITILVGKRECVFGAVMSGKVELSELGKIAHTYWGQIPDHYPNVTLGEFVVMPNHIHGIISINSVRTCHGMSETRDKGFDNGTTARPFETSEPSGTCRGMSLQNKDPGVPGWYHKTNRFSHPVSGSVSMIVNQFKGSVTRWCNKNRHGYFAWHGRFYDHVIRDNNEYDRIETYIKNNPVSWERDDYFNRTGLPMDY